mgnify:CR=1 FL=1
MDVILVCLLLASGRNVAHIAGGSLSPFDFVALINVRAVAQMAREQSLPLRLPAHADSVGHGGRRQQKQERLHARIQ